MQTLSLVIASNTDSLLPRSHLPSAEEKYPRRTTAPGTCKPYVYKTCCVNSTYAAITNMVDRAIDITYRTLYKHCEGVDDWAQQMSYELDPRKGLTLKNDWAVSYHRSIYLGRKCYYIRHSGIEYIWVLTDG